MGTELQFRPSSRSKHLQSIIPGSGMTGLSYGRQGRTRSKHNARELRFGYAGAGRRVWTLRQRDAIPRYRHAAFKLLNPSSLMRDGSSAMPSMSL